MFLGTSSKSEVCQIVMFPPQQLNRKARWTCLNSLIDPYHHLPKRKIRWSSWSGGAFISLLSTARTSLYFEVFRGQNKVPESLLTIRMPSVRTSWNAPIDHWSPFPPPLRIIQYLPAKLPSQGNPPLPAGRLWRVAAPKNSAPKRWEPKNRGMENVFDEWIQPKCPFPGCPKMSQENGSYPPENRCIYIYTYIDQLISSENPKLAPYTFLSRSGTDRTTGRNTWSVDLKAGGIDWGTLAEIKPLEPVGSKNWPSFRWVLLALIVELCRKMVVGNLEWTFQDGLLPVIDGSIMPLNGLINGVAGVITPMWSYNFHL